MGKKKSPPPAFATIGKNEHFTPMYDDQLNSPAFIALPAVAVRVYMILRQQYKGDYTGNRVKCPYERIIERGVSRNSISGAIRILEALGLISCERGGLGNQPSIYHFTEEWKAIATKEEAEAIVKRVKQDIANEKKYRKLAEESLA